MNNNRPSLEVLLKRFDTSIPIPEYKSSQAAGIDLAARLEITIPPRTVGYVPLNIALKLPVGYFALLAARSSLHKRGLTLANGIGIGDADFCGDADEYQAALFNFTDAAVTVEKGERIVQLIILPYPQVHITKVAKLTSESRGGFGSTGSK